MSVRLLDCLIIDSLLYLPLDVQAIQHASLMCRGIATIEATEAAASVNETNETAKIEIL